MVAYSSITNKKPGSDLLVLESFTNQGTDLPLSFRERDDLGRLKIDLSISAHQSSEHARRHRTVEPDFSAVDFLNSLDDVLGRHILEHYACGAETNGALMHVGIAKACQYYYPRLFSDAEHFWKKIEVASLIKRKQDDVRLLARCGRKRLGPVRSLTDYFQ